MNLLKALKIAPRPAASSVPRDMLPELNAFVDVAVGDNRQRASIPIDAIAADTFSTRVIAGMSVGGTADFLYTNPAGKFRFATTCVGIDERLAHFRIPAEVKTIASFAAKRSAVRLDSMLSVAWRFAPDGKGNGEFVKGSMTDLSRGGASLVVGRDLKVGTHVEVRIALSSAPAPLVVLGVVMRASKIESSGKSAAGLRFVNVDSAGERIIDAFIAESQQMRRNRGVV